MAKLYGTPLMYTARPLPKSCAAICTSLFLSLIHICLVYQCRKGAADALRKRGLGLAVRAGALTVGGYPGQIVRVVLHLAVIAVSYTHLDVYKRQADGSVTVQAVPFHEYTVSFLAYLIWDPVHMYNATTNGWTNFEHQITFDVRQPKTHK